MINNELRHHGIKGMKWGVRRDKKILAKLSGRKHEDISDDEAIDFRKDVQKYKWRGMTLDYGSDGNGGKHVVGYRDYKGEKITNQYADMVIRQGNKESTRFVLGSAAIAAGAYVAAKVISKLSGMKMERKLNSGTQMFYQSGADKLRDMEVTPHV